MRKTIRIILGVLNILASLNMLFFYIGFIFNAWPAYRFEVAFGWDLLFLLGAALALISGIFILKGKDWLWAIVGPIFAGIAWFFFYNILVAMNM